MDGESWLENAAAAYSEAKLKRLEDEALYFYSKV